MIDNISDIIFNAGYNDEISNIICSLYEYMEKKKWIGACYATASVLYVCLNEKGYNVKPCIGEVTTDFPVYMSFDHGWVTLDGKIIDLACSMTLMSGLPVSAPIILDIDTSTRERFNLRYGYKGRGLDQVGSFVYNQSIADYMSAFPNEKDGLWTVVQRLLGTKGSTRRLKEKYKDVNWEYIIYE